MEYDALGHIITDLEIGLNNVIDCDQYNAGVVVQPEEPTGKALDANTAIELDSEECKLCIKL